MDYDAYLNQAIAIFNEKMGADFSSENIVLTCFMAEDEIEIFEQFCSKYFPYRLRDPYLEEGYFDFYASSFVGMDNGGVDGILLQVDVPYQPEGLLHIFLHELAHLYCVHHELEGRNFYEEYCENYAKSAEEDGTITAGYAVWRECIAEIIAFECDDCCDVSPISTKKELLVQLKDEIEHLHGKLSVSEILTAVMTSSEVESSETWNDAEPAIRKIGLFHTAPELDLMKLVFTQLRSKFITIDIDFIQELGFLYLNVLSLTMLQNLQLT